MRLKKEFEDKLEAALQTLRELGLDMSPPLFSMRTTPVAQAGRHVPAAYVTVFWMTLTSAVPEKWLELET